MQGFRSLFPLVLLLLTPRLALGVPTGRVLTKAIEVRSLDAATAEQGIEATLSGTVIFYEPSAVFVQDDTSTTFFRPAILGPLKLGDRVEVKGRTQPGLFLSGLGLSEFSITGHGEVPPGTPAGYDDLMLARHHYHRVVIEGIVRSVEPSAGERCEFRVALGTRVLVVRVEEPPERARMLIDSRVRIQGLAAGFINSRRQLVEPYVRVQGWNDVTVINPALPPELLPPISATELLTYRMGGKGEHRVRIRGVVTAAFPGGQVYLRQDAIAFAARVRSGFSLSPGDRVEVLGFPEMGLFSATVADAVVVRRKPGPAPAPVELASLDQLTGTVDGDLVTVTAPLTNVFQTDGGMTLVLQSAGQTSQAHVAEPRVPAEPGALVRVTGVARVESGDRSTGFSTRARVFSLRIPSARDIVVLRSPPWWTARRLGGILVAVSSLALLALAWILVLRRQVARQTAVLRDRIEVEAAHDERQRIAREFHDTLEQELAGLTLRLDALATRDLDPKGRELIRASRNLVTRVQAETRDLISDLRAPEETAGNLTAALEELARRLSADHAMDVQVEAPAPAPPLPPAVVHDLRMIVREAVTNARKHGAATRVAIGLQAEAAGLRVCVSDNGCGFDPAAQESRRGHFGCAGMRERCRKIGAGIAWQTGPGAGTTVEVRLPLPVRTERSPDPAGTGG